MKTQGLILAFCRVTAVCALLSAASCQCCCHSDQYGDLIDCVSESSPKFDALYCPGLDVSRIGQPDWCESPVNRLWGASRCDDNCATCE